MLPDRAVITIEPGIYLPDRFGIRIEDMIQLHPAGAENLTVAPKDLIVL
jgi:Xaa-Pro aminopeptidase